MVTPLLFSMENFPTIIFQLIFHYFPTICGASKRQADHTKDFSFMEGSDQNIQECMFCSSICSPHKPGPSFTSVSICLCRGHVLFTGNILLHRHPAHLHQISPTDTSMQCKEQTWQKIINSAFF